MAEARAAERVVALAHLAAADAAIHLVGEGTTPVRDVVYDSRAVRPGALFAALRGADADGHAFVGDAVARGAAAVLAERPTGADVPHLVADDSRRALAPVAAAFHGHPSRRVKVIGVTGTDGKTTTSYLTDAVLRAAGAVTGLVGTISVQIAGRVDAHATRQTTPESADVQRYLRTMADAGVDWAILEATSHGLDLHRLDHVRFAVGAVTNITHEHLEYHKTIAAYRRAKGILFERVAEAGGVGVVNLDDAGAREMLSYLGGARSIGYGMSDEQADLRASGVRLAADGSSFDLLWQGRRLAVRLPLLGGFNVANALCAVGIGVAAGVEPATAVAALERAPAVPGRMAPVAMGQPFGLVVDYAHTPESLTKVLDLLRRLHRGGRLIVVTGSAGERDRLKRPMQGEVAARLADYAVFTSEDPRHEDPERIIAEIAAGAIRAGGRPGQTMASITDRREAIRHALAEARAGDCVLLAGKGHEGSIIWGREKRPWNEAQVAREVLAELGYGGRP